MRQVTLRFFAELSDFLPRAKRQVSYARDLHGSPTVKALIEAEGVPHTEVELILVNGSSVDWSYRVGDGDRLTVYPVFEALDVTPLVRLRPEPLRRSRFLLDAHLGKLALYLRMLGLDAAFGRDLEDAWLARQAVAEQRILLTRDRQLLMRREVTHGMFVHSQQPRRQLAEIVDRLDLHSQADPFSRCLRCNVRLERLDGEVCAPGHAAVPHDLRHCPSCQRTYWRGSHVERMSKLVSEVLRR